MQLGCKVVVYNNGDTRGSLASRGVNGWYLGLSMDHYRCDLFYIPKTRAYCISGLAELSPQHCQLPNMSQHQHLCALMDKLAESRIIASLTTKGWHLLKLLQSNIARIFNPPPSKATPRTEQRVSNKQQRVREENQRVMDDTPILTIPQITYAPPIMHAQNPTAKQVLKICPVYTNGL
jgi:hypothetical protein